MVDRILDRKAYCFLNVRKIPAKTKAEFRVACRSTRNTMEDVVAALLEKYSKSPELFKIQTGKRKMDSFLFMRNVPRALKAKFKSTCSLREDSIEDVVYTLMLAYLKNPELFRVRKAGRLRPWMQPYKEYV
jgi:tRNA(Ser,Leu) C12 N-acetylase TAN1